MNKRSDSIVLAEQQVAEARTAVLAEYQTARAQLRRHMGSRSPVFIGGVLLGAIALGYLALGRGKPKRLVYQGSPRMDASGQDSASAAAAIDGTQFGDQGRAQAPRQHQRSSNVKLGHNTRRPACTSSRSGT
jgi:hypothetical protein